MNHDFDSTVVDRAAHRPWPMPARPWVLTQTWHDLLFAHWPIDPSHIRRRIPRAFELDLFDGVAWIGIVPFHITNLAPRGVPSMGGLSAFPELNVRTYVRVDGMPGVYFFSLDAGNRMAVRAARAFLNLPYHTASMTVGGGGSRIEYHSRRQGSPAAVFSGTYEAVGSPFAPEPGSLEYFLTERYCLYHLTRRRVPYRMEIHHPRWPLQAAKADIRHNTMAEANGLHLTGGPPLLHFARRQDVIAWMPSELA
jgi:uncharacterized protein YqjF (DUF2071 family)